MDETEELRDDETEELKDDLVWGGAAIAREIGRSERQAYHMLEMGLIPGRKVGALWVSTRSGLRTRLTGKQ